MHLFHDLIVPIAWIIWITGMTVTTTHYWWRFHKEKK